MPKILLLPACLIYFSQLFCQSLEGQWEGWYTLKNSTKDTVILKLQFELNKDSGFNVYSFSEFGDEKTVCKMSYKILSAHSIYLEETEVLRTSQNSIPPMLQQMTLEIVNEYKTLKGKWSLKEKKLSHLTGGNVLLRKKLL